MTPAAAVFVCAGAALEKYENANSAPIAAPAAMPARTASLLISVPRHRGARLAGRAPWTRRGWRRNWVADARRRRRDRDLEVVRAVGRVVELRAARPGLGLDQHVEPEVAGYPAGVRDLERAGRLDAVRKHVREGAGPGHVVRLRHGSRRERVRLNGRRSREEPEGRA